MRRLGISLSLVVAALTLAASASAGPASVWLTTRTGAQHDLPGRFRNIASVKCTPDRTSATKLVGQTRYWQRFWCTGKTRDHVSFRLRYKVTGKCTACWTITNLQGVGVVRLRTRLVVVPAPSSSASGGSCGSGYYRNSRGDCVPRPSTSPNLTPSGPTALCADGTYSYSESASGTCSHHGGVARWINHP
jgi:Protein of unknown function (DUF3761)